MPALPTPDTRRFRRRVKDLAQRIEDTFDTPADEASLCWEDCPVPRIVAETFLQLLAWTEETEVLRARLTSRPHPPEREEELIRQLERQIERRNFRYNTTRIYLNAFTPAVACTPEPEPCTSAPSQAPAPGPVSVTTRRR
ncbi:hypothetical protein G4Z16_00775 [Streptomyces bathyalis]|uniref:Uncharacterized protein n=1 Tax=Streptomyces bathyalis TaxID=2710756 RepID=A0A7T1T2H3_9ACTN|nr:hypothetical protein [Streptomyces bathyalis]QPP05165.1 hypothetical protein G4Z16_00775 [Streptomyces bathyalis]